MGVFGLWDILLTTAQKIQIDKMSGKVLAIDASIWLVKADSIFAQDSQKIKCILQKIVFLRKNNILPIFVFDGIAPAIKRKTLEKRKQKIRQGSQIDVRKKTQIQVMHILQDAGKEKNNKQSSKDRRIEQKQDQMKQINKYLQTLNSVQVQRSKVVSDQDINKIKLQSQVLIYKYQLLLEDPRLIGLQTLSYEQFSNLEMEQKLQLLHLLENELHSKQSRQVNTKTINQLSKLTPEQKIFYQMDKINKKSRLRQLQDQLYRKNFQNNVKIQNGYEIVQEIRNGKKVTMKRKIMDKDANKSIWNARGFKKQKNDFSVILNYNKKDDKNNQEQQFGRDDFDMFGNQPDPFLMDLMGKDLTKNKDQNSKGKSISLSSSNPNKKLRKVQLGKQNQKQKIQKQKKSKIVSQQKRNQYQKDYKQEESSQDFTQYLGSSLINANIKKNEVLQQKSNHNQNKQENADEDKNQFSDSQFKFYDNIDNLPQFINYQNLSIRHLQTEAYKNIQFQKLLDMLGIPYIKATSQAQAQCASLQIEGLVDGVVTEDSDVFLFGARNVFRGVFNDNIKYYSSHKILQKLKLTRQKLIIFALFLGSDYTQGIKGIGIVNAMEILKIFDTFDKLQQFKRWARYADILHSEEKNTTQNILKEISNQQEKQFYEFHKKFKNYWYIDDDFPKNSVIKAYLNPQVIDQARTRQMKSSKFFELKQFNQEPVRIFMKQRLLLTYSQVEIYCCHLKKPFRRENQQKITNYFIGQDHQFAKIRSKRLLRALGQENQKQKQPQQKQ